jgi:ATP/maltotriose-dependent transcriptional regulator MalT
VLILADELDLAQHAAERALQLGRERSATPEIVGGWWLAGRVAFARGDLVTAEADLRQARELVRLGGLAGAVPLLQAALVMTAIERGELDAAEAELEAGGMLGEIPDVVWLAWSLFARGCLRVEQGRPAEAMQDFLELKRRAERWGMIGMPMMQVRGEIARALAALGEYERVRELAETALVHSRRWGAPTSVARSLRALAMALRGPEGIDALREAAALLEDSPARLERAHALSELGAALRRANRRAEARAPLREALELARRCGAAGLAKRTHDELQATGEKVRRYTPIGVESLTPSERRVAELAASGLTNRQIAQTLFVTVKTVETHLGAVFDKLDIHSRRQLAGALDPRG